jgi:hypothetical protein
MGFTAVHLLLRNLAGLIWFTLTPLDIDSVKNNDTQYERGSVWFSGWGWCNSLPRLCVGTRKYL